MIVLVKATVYFNDGTFTNKEVRVKNAMSEAHAQVKMERFFRKKYPDFKAMHVYSAKQDFFDKYNFPWR